MNHITTHITTASLLPFADKLEAAVGDSEISQTFKGDLMSFVLSAIAEGKADDPRQLARGAISVLAQDERMWTAYRERCRELAKNRQVRRERKDREDAEHQQRRALERCKRLPPPMPDWLAPE